MRKRTHHCAGLVSAALMTVSVTVFSQEVSPAVEASGRPSVHTMSDFRGDKPLDLSTEGRWWRDSSTRTEQSLSTNRSCSACGFVLGVGLGFVAHESGHLLANGVLGTDVYFKKVTAAGLPFFAIAHREVLSPRQEFAVSSAGFLTQFASGEWVLTRTPELRGRPASVSKGVMAFHLGTSAMYGIAGLGQLGPLERDTRGMATSLGIDEQWVGVAVLAPAILDTYRYFRPSSKWARWASRISKIAILIPLFTHLS